MRVSPLQDTIVALRPVVPELPWELPNSVRLLNPAMPEGSQLGFNNTDANGNPTRADHQPARQLRLGVRLALPHPEP